MLLLGRARRTRRCSATSTPSARAGTAKPSVRATCRPRRASSHRRAKRSCTTSSRIQKSLSTSPRTTPSTRTRANNTRRTPKRKPQSSRRRTRKLASGRRRREVTRRSATITTGRRRMGIQSGFRRTHRSYTLATLRVCTPRRPLAWLSTLEQARVLQERARVPFQLVLVVPVRVLAVSLVVSLAFLADDWRGLADCSYRVLGRTFSGRWDVKLRWWSRRLWRWRRWRQLVVVFLLSH